MASLAETIRKVSFFSGLSREDLARIVGKLQVRNFTAGEVIIKQGDVGDSLYVVQYGGVEVILENGSAGVENLAVLGSSECFGEMALYTGEKRSATVRTLVDSVVLKLSKENWEELLAKHPTLSFHFCKVLSRRLAETDRDISKDRGTFSLVMEEFLATQPSRMRDFLIRTSILKVLDPGAIQAALSISDSTKLLTGLSSSHPMFLHVDPKGRYKYPDYLRDFLITKLERTLGKEERDELHLRFASCFLEQVQWALAIYHYSQAELWNEVLELIKAHGDEVLEHEPPGEVLALLKAIPAQLARSHGHISRLKADAYVRLGNLDAAIHSYQEFLAQKQVSAAESFEVAQYYHELAELHQKKGEVGEALGCLRMGASLVEEGRTDLEAVEAMRSMEFLQQRGGAQDMALRWGGKTLNIAQKLSAKRRSIALRWDKTAIALFFAFAVGWVLWQMPPQAPLDEPGVHFVATLVAAVILWMFDVFDEYVVAIMLLLSWLLFGIVPTEIALAGFSKSSWFFVLGVLGMAATVTKSGLLYRVALQILRLIPPNYNIYTFLLSVSGLVVTPIFPQVKGRLGIMAPLAQTISEAMAFKPRSNGSAGLALSAYIGFSQVSFVFLTGATVSLIGWSLLPEPAKAEFGWGMWAVAALPAGIFLLLVLLLAIHFLFGIQGHDTPEISSNTLEAQLKILGPLTRGEWLSISVLALTVVGWLTKPLHGVSESWVALGALLIFLLFGVLDKKGLKNNIDWGYLLFLGVISSLAGIIPYLKVERWLVGLVEPVLSSVVYSPVLFLLTVLFLVYLLRFFLRKIPAAILLLLALIPLARTAGVHPGVVLLTILMGMETWFLPYQTDSYQIAYYSTEEKAFSHAQARRLMVAKFFASFLAVAISVPYWKMLGFIR